jgi:tetratricopeptide (TPR) repeat protein
MREESAELLSFAVPFLARMGRWEEAERLLGKLKDAGNAELFHEAGSDFFRRKGNLEKAAQHAEACVQESPLAMNARSTLLGLIAKRDGADAAAERGAQWFREHPGHDQLEQLYSQNLEQSSAPIWKRYALLRRRVRRNREDGWAWRQLASYCVAEHGSADQEGKERLKRRLVALIRECERTAPAKPATMRLRAQWCEAQGQWEKAIEQWTRSIEQDPHNFYGHRRLWELLARSSADERRALWQKVSDGLLAQPGRLSTAREIILLVAQRFGVAEAEEAASTWQNLRPDDPEVIAAYADLLLEHGHGRSDAQRALELLRPAIERFPYHERLRFSLADAQRRLGQFREAEETLAEIIRRHPENSSAQIQLAQVRGRHGRLEEALKTLADPVCAIRRTWRFPKRRQEC